VKAYTSTIEIDDRNLSGRCDAQTANEDEIAEHSGRGHGRRDWRRGMDMYSRKITGGGRAPGGVLSTIGRTLLRGRLCDGHTWTSEKTSKAPRLGSGCPRSSHNSVGNAWVSVNKAGVLDRRPRRRFPLCTLMSTAFRANEKDRYAMKAPPEQCGRLFADFLTNSRPKLGSKPRRLYV